MAEPQSSQPGQSIKPVQPVQSAQPAQSAPRECGKRQSGNNTETDQWKAASLRVAAISGVFCILLSLLLIYSFIQGLTYDPLTSPELVQMKTALKKSPLDEKLKGDIRALDLKLRYQVSHRQVLTRQGTWFLIGGMAIFLLSYKSAKYQKTLRRPAERKEAGEYARQMQFSRLATGAATLAFIGVGWFISANSTTLLTEPIVKTEGASAEKLAAVAKPIETAPVAAEPAPATPFPTQDEMYKNWPRFRGPGGRGVAAYTNYPAMWDVAKGENILWKTKVPLLGPNSPVVWGNRVFMTGGNAAKREVYCFDAQKGALLWQSAILNPNPSKGEQPNASEDIGGYGAATACTDGRRVYAIFATGELAAFDYSGKQVWLVALGLPDNTYGLATSLDFYQDKLLVLFDQGEAKAGKSKLLAFDTKTGQKVWESLPRPVPNSWATPIVIQAGQKDQIITCGNPWVIAYNPADGVEIWRAKALYGEVTPSPTFGGGFVITAIEGEKLSAIKPDGQGDVTKTHVAWTAEEGLPDITSPLCDGKRIYLVSSAGNVTCYGIDGKMLWNKDLEIGFKSSPSLMGNRVVLFGDKGTTVLIEAGDQFKELGRVEMGEDILSSPAFMDGRFFIRGKENLFCIGSK